MFHLNFWNPPGVASSFPLPHCKFPMLPLHVCLVVILSLLDFCVRGCFKLVITLYIWGNILFFSFCCFICSLLYLVVDVLGFHVQMFQLLRCHNIVKYMRKQFYHLTNLHSFLARPWHFATRIITPI